MVLRWLHRGWPVLAIGLCGGAVYLLLLLCLDVAIDAERHIRPMIPVGPLAGPATLFLMASGVLGWISVFVAEARFGVCGPVVWVHASPAWCIASCVPLLPCPYRARVCAGDDVDILLMCLFGASFAAVLAAAERGMR